MVEVDAVLGVYRNVEGIELEQRGFAPTVIPLDRAGVPRYDELVLVASSERLRSSAAYRDVVERFVNAFLEGTDEARANPDRSLQVMDEVTASKRAFLAASVPATLELLGSGCLSEARVGAVRRLDARARPPEEGRPGKRRDDDPLPRVALRAVGRSRARFAPRTRRTRSRSRGSTPERASRPGADTTRPSVTIPGRRAVEGEERDQLARRAGQRPLTADHVNQRVAENGIQLDGRKLVASEDEQLAEQMVEASLDPADDEDPAGLERERRIEGELEIGRVLGGRMPLDACSAGGKRIERFGRGRVEVSDGELDRKLEGERMVGTAVRRDYRRSARDRGDRPRARGGASGDDHDSPGHAGSLTSRGASSSVDVRRFRTGTSPAKAAGSSSPTRGT